MMMKRLVERLERKEILNPNFYEVEKNCWCLLTRQIGSTLYVIVIHYSN